MVLSRGDHPPHPSCIHFMTTLMFFASRFFNYMFLQSNDVQLFNKILTSGDEKVAQNLGVVTTPLMYLGLIPSTYVADHNLLQIQFNGLFWSSWIWHANLQTDKMLRYIKPIPVSDCMY